MINEIEIMSNNENDNDKNNPTPALNFDDLKLIDEVIEAVLDQGFTNPTEIQQQAIPLILQRKDVLGSAQTGSGKTAAFVLPMLQNLFQQPHKKSGKKVPRALILAPTRELANQISETVNDCNKYTNLKHVVIYGGVSQRPQVKRLRRGVDIIIATPGRLLDLINQGFIELESIEMFTLDEADRMLDMGFYPDIKRLQKYMPAKKQTLLFSATIPDKIEQLAQEIQHNPVLLTIDPPTATVATVTPYLYFVSAEDKFDLLTYIFDNQPEISKALVFCRTKYGCDKLVKKLKKQGFAADRIHGNRSQNQREKALDDFRDDVIDILVGTDVAARGIDVDNISHVINYDMTNEPEVYIHRVGRTARAGKEGTAISFVASHEKKLMHDVEYTTQELMVRVMDHPFSPKGQGEELTDLSRKPTTQNSKSNKGSGKKRNPRRRQKFYRSKKNHHNNKK